MQWDGAIKIGGVPQHADIPTLCDRVSLLKTQYLVYKFIRS